MGVVGTEMVGTGGIGGYTGEDTHTKKRITITAHEVSSDRPRNTVSPLGFGCGTSGSFPSIISGEIITEKSKWMQNGCNSYSYLSYLCNVVARLGCLWAVAVL